MQKVRKNLKKLGFVERTDKKDLEVYSFLSDCFSFLENQSDSKEVRIFKTIFSKAITVVIVERFLKEQMISKKINIVDLIFEEMTHSNIDLETIEKFSEIFLFNPDHEIRNRIKLVAIRLPEIKTLNLF